MAAQSTGGGDHLICMIESSPSGQPLRAACDYAGGYLESVNCASSCRPAGFHRSLVSRSDFFCEGVLFSII